MITEEQLFKITEYLKENVWRNPDIMYELDTEEIGSLVDIISTLHNLLYECVTGVRYNYAWHWTNKLGMDILDNVFDTIINEV